ncbi:DUF6232 family protein [Streptomyces sp. NPDC089919]|uniref:DUF6232 family protein n=1 Tax=Streptomyces sp. NPDC089919 TaxID=3155188 RepID=UPI003426E925
MSNHMLFVGSAVVPLHNITWVEPYMQKPDRRKAALNALLLSLVAALVLIVAGAAGGTDEDFQAKAPLLLLFVLVAVVVAVARPAKPALAIQSSGGSTVVLTLPTLEELRTIAGGIVNAIENPEREFSTVVHQFNNTNHFGPVVNMTGGRGNTGIG